MLLGQSRYELAEQEFRREVTEDPEDGLARAMLAQCLSLQDKHIEAEREAREAIRLAPDSPFPHYVLARSLYDRDIYGQAEAVLGEAIRLDPYDADYHSLQAAIMAEQSRNEEALAAAERGLEIDPEHVGCNNLRAMTLVRLNRAGEAGQTISSTLSRNPESPITHANQGWTLLHQGDHAQAFDHFREALRLDPGMEWARQGIVEAMKARNPLYRPILGFLLWTSRLSGKAQWAVLIALFLGPRILGNLGRANPTLQPFVFPLATLIVLFIALTWVADPLFNLVLRLDRFGRLALSREQVIASNWIGACVAGVVLGLLAFAVTFNPAALVGAISSGLLMVPVSAVFACPSGWRRVIMAVYTAGLAGLAALGTVSLAVAPARMGKGLLGGEAGAVVGVVLVGSVLSTWLAFALAKRR
jgi:tetratricopeptide (TPR) repeat protein